MKKIVAGLLIMILSACNSSDNSSGTSVTLKEKVMNDLKGYKIVFASPHNNDVENNSDIWIMNPDGSGAKNLTPDTDGDDVYPEWGPGAHYIYYTSTAHEGAFELYRVNVNGKKPPKQLTNLGREVRSVSVSADNTRIALGVMSGDSTGAEELSEFSADLYLLEMGTLEEALEANELVTMDDLDVLLSAPRAGHLWFEQPCWAPSQDQSLPFLAYSRTAGYDTDDETESVWIIKADGSENQQITKDDSMPRWMADGKHIVTFGFSVIEIETGGERKLRIDGLNESAGSASISPDGNYVLFETEDESRKAGLASVVYNNDDAAVTNPYIILSDLYAYEPRWSPKPVSDNSVPSSKGFTKQVTVFGVPVKATAGVSDAKLLHAAKIMAGYLDNDEDGVPDNIDVVDALVREKAVLMMFENENEPGTIFSGEEDFPENGQDLYATETHPEGSGANGFDASLEEVLHLITHVGYANVYPDVFGESGGSDIADAMDIARGGFFETIPDQYPAGAWYAYDDETCDYSCQVTEYTYWALTSIAGAQDYDGRLEEIQQEWKLNTREKVEQNDPAVYKSLTDPAYSIPLQLPDGHYEGTELSINLL